MTPVGARQPHRRGTAFARIAAFLGAFVALSTLTSCGGGDRGVTTAELQQILADDWQAFAGSRKNFGGGLALQILSPRDEVFLSTGMGEAMSNGHRFRTASVTKTFTAAAIMLLQNRGKLDIEHRITDDIPGTRTPYVPATADYDIPHKSELTIRMVLMHRAGVFDLSNQDVRENPASRDEPYVGENYLDYRLSQDAAHQFTFDELFGVIARDRQVGFDEAPGSRYKYSDTGYNLLALIVERVSGKSFGDFVRDELLVPNGLAATTLPWKGADQDLPAPFVSGYLWSADTLSDVTKSNMSPFVGNGNVVTTPLDLATWCRRLFSGEAGLPVATVEAMKAGLPRGASASTYGLGIIFEPTLGYGHGGAHAGYLTLMYYRPESGTAFVAMSNVWDLSRDTASLEAQQAMMAATANKILTRLGL